VAAVILFLALVLAVAAWWLWREGLAAKPWLEQGVAVDTRPAGPGVPAAMLGLGVFLAVVGSLFALFVSAYFMRMHVGDWRPLPDPDLLWLNTGVLILSSVALQAAEVAARRGRIDGVRLGLLAGGGLALLFLIGQLAAWRLLDEAGYYLTTNPANAFFYMITAMHGAHILGGLVALARTGARVWRGADAASVRLGVELCAVYWHFLLIVWLVLFWVLLRT
jgi:cytochrome c oxidase subunit 3